MEVRGIIRDASFLRERPETGGLSSGKSDNASNDTTILS
jgi:hypothetical protein